MNKGYINKIWRCEILIPKIVKTNELDDAITLYKILRYKQWAVYIS